MRGIVLGGTASGVGKTVATLAVIRAAERAGYAVQPAKAGPDFIDPSHHAAVAETPSRTLDPWLCGRQGMLENYHRGSGDLCVVEGVMGLYDGGETSTAHVAAALDLPVALVTDGSAGMESVAATAMGFAAYADEIGLDVDVAGVVAQRVHGGRHEEGIRAALPDELAYFGRIPPDPDLEIPDRHLGLHMGEEAPVPTDALDEAAAHLDIEAILARASEPPAVDSEPAGDPTDRRIAVARDPAFRFCYPAVRERLATRATVRSFSPIAGDPVPDCDGVYLPGGYPELHAGALAESDTLGELTSLATDGTPILGECGGFMALAQSLTTADGETHPMARILPADVRMDERLQALDHVELRATADTLTAAAGNAIRGHEFHYSRATVDGDARFAFAVERGDGIDGDRDGLTEHRTLGTYAHVHAASGAFDHFIDSI